MDDPQALGLSVTMLTADGASFVLERDGELGVLLSAISASTDRPQFVYIWGPPASGKTVLMDQLVRRLRPGGPAALYTPGSTDGILDHLPISLSQLRDPLAGSDYSGLVDALTREAENGRFVWIVDAYDERRDQDLWFCEQVFTKLPAGTTVVLTGRQAPTRLWAGRRIWRNSVRTLELRDLSDEDALKFLVDSGVEDAQHRVDAVTLSGGRIGLLARAVDSLRVLEGQERLAPGARRRPRRGNDSKLVSYLIEHILHPGSRRASWRAGVGRDSVDTLLAAASLVPIFHRNMLAAMVGRPLVDALWDDLVELPAVERFEGGFRALPERLRHRMEGLVHQLRPWTGEQWRKAILAYLVAEVHEGDSGEFARIWTDIARLAHQSIWDDVLHPFGGSPEPWHYEWDEVERTEGQDTLAIRYESLGKSEYREPASDNLEALLALDRSGAIVGSVVTEIRSGRDKDILRVTGMAISPGARGVERALIRELASEWGRYSRVEWGASTYPADQDTLSVEPALELLQFQPVAASGTETAWVLDFEAITYHDWLARVVNRVSEVPAAQKRVDMVRDALAAIHSPDDLVRTELAQHFGQSRSYVSPGQVRTWVVDALTSADLGEWPSGRILLTLYYLDRRGSHEALAEQLNVSRATYFRSHRRAIAMLADALFDVTP